ncbi:MAG: outer membrane protein assembly factor BamD [Planctomycetota bacterium]
MHEHVSKLLATVLLILAAVTPVTAEREYVWEGGEWTSPAKTGEDSPAGQIALIRVHLDEGDYRDAVKVAERFLEKYPDNEACEEAMMLAGQAEMDRGRYMNAYDWFDRQIARSPSGPLAGRALHRQYEIADAFLEGKKRRVLGFIPVSARSEGLSILDRIVSQAPGSELAEKALLRMGDYHEAREEYDEAIDAYDRYVEMFPRGESAAYAMLQAARSRYAMYRGPSFDDTPLLEARLRFRHFAERFGQAAEENNVSDILRRIDEQRAEKDFHAARFYERTGRDDAADFYYRRIVRNYGRTEYANRAGRALGETPETAPEDSSDDYSHPRRDVPRIRGLESLADEDEQDQHDRDEQ